MRSLLVCPIKMAEQVLENISFLQTFLAMLIMEEMGNLDGNLYTYSVNGA